MGEQDNLYKTLFVSESAAAEEIRKAYFILAKKFHDDLNRSASPEERAFCENALKEINGAYEVLAKPDRRAAYDRSRRQPQSGPKPTGNSVPDPKPNPNPKRGYQPPPNRPEPVATPGLLDFGVLRPGDTRGMSFFLANEGDLARTCRLSVGRHLWIQVPPEVDKLPARIPVEVHIPENTPPGLLTGVIQVQMDSALLEIRIVGQIENPPPAARPNRGGIFTSLNRNQSQARGEEPKPKAKCPFCGFENPPGTRTCRHCELPLTRDSLTCPYCGERLPSSACNCPGCGKFVTLW